MADVTTKRTQDLVLLRTDVRTVPAEVERLLKPKFDGLPSQIWTVGEPHLAALRDELERYLQGMEARLVTKLDAPETAPARQMLLDEMHELRELGVRQFDMLTARMSAIDQTLAALKAAPSAGEKNNDPTVATAADIS